MKNLFMASRDASLWGITSFELTSLLGIYVFTLFMIIKFSYLIRIFVFVYIILLGFKCRDSNGAHYNGEATPCLIPVPSKKIKRDWFEKFHIYPIIIFFLNNSSHYYYYYYYVINFCRIRTRI